MNGLLAIIADPDLLAAGLKSVPEVAAFQINTGICFVSNQHCLAPYFKVHFIDVIATI